MKKLICALLAIVMCFGLVACAKKGEYTDGTYQVNAAEFSHGWKEYVTITVADGNIASVEFDALNEAGDKKSADPSYKDNMVAGNKAKGLPETYPEKFYPELAENLKKANYDAAAVEIVAGATHSSDSFKVLAAKAMEMVKAGKPGEFNMSPYTDGTYKVNAAEFSHGWKEYVVLTVEGGEITAVEFDAVNEAGDKKSADPSYKDNMVAGNKAKGLPETYPEKFYPEIAENFVAAKGDVEAMEAVGGATHSFDSFKVLAAKALENAKAGEPAEFNMSPYTDGTYTVENADFSHGWKDYIVVTVENGEVSAIEFDSKNESGAKKSADPSYKDSMVAGNKAKGLPETYPEKFFPEIIENYMTAGSVETMESVAGATSSSNSFKKLMAKALEAAKEGNTEVVVLFDYAEGKYRAEAPADSHGWSDFVEITIANGSITEITFDSVNAEGTFKSKDPSYKESMTAYGGTTYPEKFFPEIVENYINSGFVANDMEVVAGATTSSESFKALVTAALKAAKEGNTETVVLADEK